jgi:AraC-like DNA-binding protein
VPSPTRDGLLNDLRVVDARCGLLQLGSGIFDVTEQHRPALYLVLRGDVVFSCHDKAPKITAHAGDCVLILYGDSHRLELIGDPRPQPLSISLPLQDGVPHIEIGDAPERSAIFSAVLELAYLSPSAFVHRVGQPLWAVRRDNADPTATKALLLDMDQVHDSLNGEGNTAFAASLASLLFVHSMRDMRERNWYTREAEAFSPAARRIAAAVRAIETHLDRNWTVALLAREVGLSRSAFAAAFRDHLGTPPLSYITNLRMRRAAQLLEIDAITQREVAERVGYHRESSFARIFKKYYGVSPRTFADRRLVAQEPMDCVKMHVLLESTQSPISVSEEVQI